LFAQVQPRKIKYTCFWLYKKHWAELLQMLRNVKAQHNWQHGFFFEKQRE